MLVDEPDEAEAETEAEVNVEGDQVSLTPESAKLLKNAINKELAAGNEEGDDGDKISSSSSDEEIDETERAKRIQAEIEKEKQLKRKRREEKDDDEKQSARKKVATPRAKGLKILLKKKPVQKPSKPPTPPPELQHQLSPIHSPLHQTPPRQPSPIQSPLHLSPPHLSPPHIHVATPPHEQQPVVTSQQIFQTPPSTQPPVQITPGSSGYKRFPTVLEGLTLEEIGDFGFANDEQVKGLEKKMEEVLVENKKLLDREKKLEKRVKSVEAENTSLLKKIEADQTEIDILKVKVAELEEEKARRDEQNKYFELKNKELEAAKAMKEHEIYMMNKVLENMLGKSVEQRFEEIEGEEVRAKRQAGIDAEMKFKGKGVESSEVTERSIVPYTILESPIQNPRPISAISGIFEEVVLLDDVINEEEDIEEDDDEEDDDKEDDDDDDKVDDADDVFSESSHSDNDDDDNDQGGTGDVSGEGESVEDQNVDMREKLILRLELEVEEGEFRHVYTMKDIVEITRIADPDFKFDFEEELNAFDVNQQPDYEYKYVEEADVYDRVEVEDCTDEESNADELRRKVAKCLKDKNFDGTTKDPQKEEHKKWFRKSNERKFKRPLKFYKRDRDVSLGDIISWGFIPQVNAYAIRREFGVQYFECIQDIMSLPWNCHTSFIYWVYSCLTTEAVIIYRVENEVRYIHVYDPLWLVNYSAKDIECLFVNKTGFKVEDKDQAMQFQKVVSICFQKGINADNKLNSKWREIEKEEAREVEKRRKAREDKDNMLMHTVNQRMAGEEKKKVDENEKLRKLLMKKPKPREEKFKSL
ncbi:hypothetical protein Hanom_Chr09g00766131 [Helianthus anomalus]